MVATTKEELDMYSFPNLEGVEPTTLGSFDIALCVMAGIFLYAFYLGAQNFFGFGRAVKPKPSLPPPPTPTDD